MDAVVGTLRVWQEAVGCGFRALSNKDGGIINHNGDMDGYGTGDAHLNEENDTPRRSRIQNWG